MLAGANGGFATSAGGKRAQRTQSGVLPQDRMCRIAQCAALWCQLATPGNCTALELTDQWSMGQWAYRRNAGNFKVEVH
jgi:hypothetical protein